MIEDKKEIARNFRYPREMTISRSRLRSAQRERLSPSTQGCGIFGLTCNQPPSPFREEIRVETNELPGFGRRLACTGQLRGVRV